MPITFNGAEVKGVLFNANYLETQEEVQKVLFNGAVVWEKSSAFNLGNIPLGSLVYIEEEDGWHWWRLWDKNYNGTGVPVLMREETKGYDRYLYSDPSSAYNNKYPSSSLDVAMISIYDNLPTTTQQFILKTDVPHRTSASASNEQQYLSRHVFAPSCTELGVDGSTYEGIKFSYNGSIASDHNYWTREPVGGMPQYAYMITTSGSRSSSKVSTNQYIRPCMCMASSVPLDEVAGGYKIKY